MAAQGRLESTRGQRKLSSARRLDRVCWEDVCHGLAALLCRWGSNGGARFHQRSTPARLVTTASGCRENVVRAERPRSQGTLARKCSLLRPEQTGDRAVRPQEAGSYTTIHTEVTTACPQTVTLYHHIPRIRNLKTQAATGVHAGQARPVGPDRQRPARCPHPRPVWMGSGPPGVAACGSQHLTGSKATRTYAWGEKPGDRDR